MNNNERRLQMVKSIATKLKNQEVFTEHECIFIRVAMVDYMIENIEDGPKDDPYAPAPRPQQL